MDYLVAFWAEVRSVWESAAFGVGVGELLLGLAVLLAFVLLRGVFTRFVIKALMRLTHRTETRFDDELLHAAEPPLRLAFVVAGLFFAMEIAPLPDDVTVFMTRVVRSLIAFTIFWALYRFVTPFSFLIHKAVEALGHQGLGTSLEDFFTKLAKFVIACVGVVAVLEEWDFNVSAVLGGLGLIGMAVAFGAQNVIANLFGGLTILMDQIYEKGDWIRAGPVEGTVEEIGFRATKIRRFDKALTTIPNDKLAGDAVINFSRMTNRRIYWKIGVEYRTTEAQLRQIVTGMHDYIFNTADFETDPARVTTLIHVDSFNDSSIDIMLYCFTRTTNWGEWMRVKEQLAYQIKQIVEGAGTGFAFPSSSVYLESLPFGIPETFPASATPAAASAAAADN